MLSKLRTQFIFDHAENKFEKTIILNTIKILQTPKIIFKTMDELQKYRLLDYSENLFTLESILKKVIEFNIDIFIQNTYYISVRFLNFIVNILSYIIFTLSSNINLYIMNY